MTTIIYVAAMLALVPKVSLILTIGIITVYLINQGSH